MPVCRMNEFHISIMILIEQMYKTNLIHPCFYSLTELLYRKI